MAKTFEIDPSPIEFIDDSDDAYFIVHVESLETQPNPEITFENPQKFPTKRQKQQKNEIKPTKVEETSKDLLNSSTDSNDIPKPIFPCEKANIQVKTDITTTMKQEISNDPYYNWYIEVLHANERLNAEISKYERKRIRKQSEAKKNISIKKSENDNLAITNSKLVADKRRNLTRRENELKEKQAQKESDSRYSKINSLNKQSKQTEDAFTEAANIIQDLCKVLPQFPLEENDFIPILKKYNFDDEICSKIQEFIHLLMDAYIDS